MRAQPEPTAAPSSRQPSRVKLPLYRLIINSGINLAGYFAGRGWVWIATVWGSAEGEAEVTRIGEVSRSLGLRLGKFAGGS